MPEEESGFTFVDKRRTAPEAEVTAAPAPEAEVTPPIAETNTDDLMAGDLSAEELSTEELSTEEMSEADLNRSPGTYELIGYCINLLAQQAWLKLGLLADPETGIAAPDLDEAKVAVDTVGDLAARLEAAPEGIVPADLRRDLKTLLNDLRLNYVSQRGTAS